MFSKLNSVVQQYPKGFRNDLLETKKTSEMNLHMYLQNIFGKGYTKHFRKEKLVRPENEINSMVDIAVNAGALAHGGLFCGAPGCGKSNDNDTNFYMT